MPFQPPTEQPDKPGAAPATVAPAPTPATRRRPRMIEADRLFNRPWAIEQGALQSLVAYHVNGVAAGWDDDDDDKQQEDNPYQMTDDGIACISVNGPLAKYAYWRGTSYGSVCQAAAHAYANDSVKAVLFCYDSPGGEAPSDWFEACDYLYGARDLKPTAAISKDRAYSAAYLLASTAPRLFCTFAAGTGSIGCWVAHVDMSEMDKQMGIKVTYVFAGAKKVDGNPHEPLSDRAQDDMQQECDRIRDEFVRLVARNRGVSADDLYDTEAGICMASDGCPLLADQVGTAADALNYLRGQIAAKAAIVQGTTAAAQAGAQAGVLVQSELAADSVAADYMPTLTARAFGPGGTGRADHTLPDEYSTSLFGQPGAVLAVRRSATAANLATDPSRRISMLVVPYDGSLSTNLGGFREVYERGCFAQGLDNDPRALFNHDEACVLGRKSAGTARFWEDAAGVHVEADAPETQWADDLIVSMRRGDITNSSAAFWILQQRWESRNGERVRVVEKAMLRDASVLAFAAYETTRATVAAASASTGTPVAIASARLKILRLR